jgi:hypothetical protein
VKLTPDEELMLKIINGGRKNLNEWFEIIIHDYIEEQAIKDRSSVETIKDKFYTDLHNGFLCTVSSLLHKFMLDKGSQRHCRIPTPLGKSSTKLKLERKERRVGRIP